MSTNSPSATGSGLPVGENGSLTETDRRFLEAAITCLKSPPELDIQKLADKMGVKPKTITNRWCDLKKKLFVNVDTPASSSESGGGGSVVTPRKRKSEKAGGEASATKKPRTPAKPRGKKAAAVPAAGVMEDTGDLQDGKDEEDGGI